MSRERDSFLGIDIGSTYTKLVVVDTGGAILATEVIPTLSRRREQFEETVSKVNAGFNIVEVCATGYGRHGFDCHLRQPELVCAAVGVACAFPRHQSIIDIGGEDLKVIESDPDGAVLNFSMNDKCSAGTGSFITEIAEKAELEIVEMSELAEQSTASRTINSFCTVFARTEIMEWQFAGVPLADIARGIYLSLVTRISRMALKPGLPVALCGGVIAHHPYLRDLLAERISGPVDIVPQPQLAVALGAAMIARREKSVA